MLGNGLELYPTLHWHWKPVGPVTRQCALLEQMLESHTVLSYTVETVTETGRAKEGTVDDGNVE